MFWAKSFMCLHGYFTTSWTILQPHEQFYNSKLVNKCIQNSFISRPKDSSFNCNPSLSKPFLSYCHVVTNEANTECYYFTQEESNFTEQSNFTELQKMRLTGYELFYTGNELFYNFIDLFYNVVNFVFDC